MLTVADTTVTLSSSVDGAKTSEIDTNAGSIAIQGLGETNTALTSLTINSDGSGTIEVANIGDGFSWCKWSNSYW